MDYHSGALAADVRERFDAHLEECPDCRAYLATYRATIELARAAFAPPDGEPMDVPDEFVGAVLAALRA
jgi:anti-sigma factor RsiW